MSWLCTNEVDRFGSVDRGGPDVDGAGRQAAGHVDVDGLCGRCRCGLDDRRVVGVVRRFQSDVAAVGFGSAEVTGAGVEELPARRGELRDLRGRPGALADAVVARPRLGGRHQPDRRVRQVGVDRGEQRPVDVRGHLRVGVPAGDRTDQRRRPGGLVLRSVLAGPQRFAGVLRSRVPRAAGRGTAVTTARIVRADDLHRARERRVARDVVGDTPVTVRADDLHTAVAGVVQRGTQLLVPGDVVAALVPTTEIVDRQTVGLGTAEPRDQVVDRIRRPEPAADPARSGPRQSVQLDVGVAGLGLLHQPELVTRVAVDDAARMFDRRLRAVGRVRVAPDLDLEDLQVGAVVRLEQVVEDLTLLRSRIVLEQPRVTATAADRADAVEHATGAAAVDSNRRGGRRIGRRRSGTVKRCGDQRQRRQHDEAAEGSFPRNWLHRVSLRCLLRRTGCPPFVNAVRRLMNVTVFGRQLVDADRSGIHGRPYSAVNTRSPDGQSTDIRVRRKRRRSGFALVSSEISGIGSARRFDIC